MGALKQNAIHLVLAEAGARVVSRLNVDNSLVGLTKTPEKMSALKHRSAVYVLLPRLAKTFDWLNTWRRCNFKTTACTKTSSLRRVVGMCTPNCHKYRPRDILRITLKVGCIM